MCDSIIYIMIYIILYIIINIFILNMGIRNYVPMEITECHKFLFC